MYLTWVPVAYLQACCMRKPSTVGLSGRTAYNAHVLSSLPNAMPGLADQLHPVSEAVHLMTGHHVPGQLTGKHKHVAHG